MKIKTSFVTNSSSTSYVMWGVYLKDLKIEENEELLNKIYEYSEEVAPNKHEAGNSKRYELDVISNYLNKQESKLTFEKTDCYSDNYIIGYELDNISEDKTITQIKEEVLKELNEKLDANLNIKDIQKINICYYDG